MVDFWQKILLYILFILHSINLDLPPQAMMRDKEDGNVYNTTPVSDQAMITVISQVGDHRITVNVVFSSTLMRPEPSALQLQGEGGGHCCQENIVLFHFLKFSFLKD